MSSSQELRQFQRQQRARNREQVERQRQRERERRQNILGFRLQGRPIFSHIVADVVIAPENSERVNWRREGF